MSKRDAFKEYIGKHRINELFTVLTASLGVYQPEDVKSFLIEELTRRHKEGVEASLITVPEIEAVFDMNDLLKKGTINRERVRATQLESFFVLVYRESKSALYICEARGGRIKGIHSRYIVKVS